MIFFHSIFPCTSPPPHNFSNGPSLKSISCPRPTPEPLTREKRFCSLANFGSSRTTCLSPRLRNGVVVVVVVVVFLFFQKKDGVGEGGYGRIDGGLIPTPKSLD